MIYAKIGLVLPALLLAWIAAQPYEAAAQCRLCAAAPDRVPSKASSGETETPLNIEITTNLDFSRLALLNRAGGEVELDPESGQRRFSGGITDLGGLSLHGEGRLTGEPGRLVRVQLPERITLNAPNGSTADLVKLDTDLPAQARLDRDGRLTFSFGGRLRVTGSASGQFRGRIAITANYE
ncbi:DUF4402 domain-containing protein [Parasphingorhabdus cellanae]|uniref:DUF4402 domain-containing protein n=1 Tax=Parasphingorhabdus cellanae TaxID=2806553 RepID=A0ABX7SZR3_9SPHN|nr:DUF4402 domain-containing protein [Parasphingorhabdus cellanae]QTD54756.1 DUF4402 domain-containing protein [Parasphingorhabdus cellanae]